MKFTTQRLKFLHSGHIDGVNYSLDFFVESKRLNLYTQYWKLLTEGERDFYFLKTV